MPGVFVSEDSRDIFIHNLCLGFCIVQAAELAGYDSDIFYIARGRDPEFAAMWDRAREAGRLRRVDAAEDAAWMFATKGTQRYLNSATGLIMDPKNPSEPLMEAVWYPTVTLAMLKAHKPETYAPKADAAPAMPADLLPDPEPAPDEPGPAKPIY